MSRHGPTRGEHRLRLIVSLAGLALLVGGLVVRGLPSGLALVEVVGIGGLFLGGSAGWSAWKLRSGR